SAAHNENENPRRPASSIVGISGAAAIRFRDVRPRAFMLPARTNGSAVAVLMNVMSICHNVLHQRSAATIGHQGKSGAGLLLHQDAEEMRGAADADGP